MANQRCAATIAADRTQTNMLERMRWYQCAKVRLATIINPTKAGMINLYGVRNCLSAGMMWKPANGNGKPVGFKNGPNERTEKTPEHTSQNRYSPRNRKVAIALMARIANSTP